MKKQLMIVGAVVSAACCSAQTAKPETDIVVKARITLADGSQFLGSPRFASFVLVMDFGKLEIPLSHVSTLDFTKDAVKVGFYNKDTLSGKLEGTSFAFDTIFNEANLEYAQIKSMKFSKQRDVSQSAKAPGLLLYAPLDTDTASHDAFGARIETKKIRIVEGNAGNAMLLDSADAKLTIHLPFSPHTMSEGTIEFWAKLPQPRQRFNSNGGQPWFFNIEGPGRNYDRHFVFGFTANDSAGKGGLVGRIHGVATTGTHYPGSVSNIAETGLLRETPDGWHHYAIIWNVDGVDFPDARGKSLALTVDGKIVAVANKSNNGEVRPTETEGFRLVVHDGNSDCTRPVAISDLKIWKHAKLPDVRISVNPAF